MRIYGRSYQGKRHIEHGKPCQDAWSTCKTPDGWVVAAVADGVGASHGSELGSKAAVESVKEYFSAYRSPYLDDESIEFVLRDAFNYALRRVKEATETPGAEAYSGLTTLHVLLYGERIGLHWGQCGDGALFLRGKAGQWKRLTTPMKDDGSPVTLQQSSGKWEFGSLHAEGLSVVMLATDGVAEAIHDQSQTPEVRRATAELVMNPPAKDRDGYYDELFFGEAPDAADETPDASARRRLLAIDDDITLLTLALAEPEETASAGQPDKGQSKMSIAPAGKPKPPASRPKSQDKPTARKPRQTNPPKGPERANAFVTPTPAHSRFQPKVTIKRRRAWWQSRNFNLLLWVGMGTGALMMVAGVILILISRFGG